jgi:adenosine deaminase
MRWQPALHTLILSISLAEAQGAPPPIERRFDELRKSPPELYAFLLRMPKGADLHNHLSGAIYAETYLRAAEEDGLCIDLKTYALAAAPCREGTVEAARASSDNTLSGQVIDSLSMRGWGRSWMPGRESPHDHFFAAFAKFGPNRPNRRGEFMAEVVRRAASQNESYLELMTINGVPANAPASRVHFKGDLDTADFDAARNTLMGNGLAEIVKQISANIEMMDEELSRSLQCNTESDSPACRVVVRHMYQVLRESSKELVFAQILAGLMLASSNPRVVGVNFVQPEDGATSMRDYHLQMRMLDYAKGLYPNVHVSLHAGELTQGLVPPEGLRFHIREAVELGHAERIGHGVDIMEETNATGLLALMRQRRVLVEINLTSNDLILGVRGRDHPLPVYLKYGVPVALSTDDEGVSRSHLTEEYVRAVETYGLTYAQLKDMVRNSLEYSFLPGASYWPNHSLQAPSAGCGAKTQTKPCQTLLKSSEKARMQADLEDRFERFERSVLAKPK